MRVFKWTPGSWFEDQDFFRFSGIYRSVFLYALPETALLSYVGKATNKAGTTSRLYRAEYTLPLGFLLPDDTDTLWSYAAGSPIKVQNSFVNVAAEYGGGRHRDGG